MAPLLLVLLSALALAAAPAQGISVVVSNGYETHAALTSPEVTWMLIAGNITFSLDTCPFPASEDFPATIISRNLTIVSLSPEAIAAAAAAGAPLESAGAAAASQITTAAANSPFWINCQHLDGRFQLHAGFSIEFRSLVLVNCRTLSTAGFITKRHGSTLILNNTVENQGSICLPVQTAQSLTKTLDRQPGLAVPAGYTSSQQYTSLAGPGSWCSATAAANAKQSLAPQLLANRTDSITCQQSALLLGNTAWEENPTPINGSLQNTNPKPENFTMLATRSAILCPNPVSTDCLRQNGSDACLAAAFRAVNPDANPPCPAFNGLMVHNCLNNPSVSKILILADVQMNTSTCPSWLSEDPFVINRNVMIMSDPRAPRLQLDCGLMTDRVQIPSGVTITLHHLILSRCSIGHEKPLMLFRFDQGSKLVVNDTYLLQPDGLCLPVQQQYATANHQTRSTEFGPGINDFKPGEPQKWCPASSGTRTAAAADDTGNVDGDPRAPANTDPTSGAADNNSYSVLPPLPQEFANRTGLGPVYAASLDQPAVNAYYSHHTWPYHELCRQGVLLLKNVSYDDRFGWTLPPGTKRSTAIQAMQQQAASAQASNDPTRLPADLIQQLGPGYNGTLPVLYINSVWLCPQPNMECTAQPAFAAQRACLLQAYTKVNPDVVGQQSGGGGASYGVSVVLPAVLGSVGGVLLLLAALFGFSRLMHKRDIKHAQASLGVAKGPYDPGHSTPTSQRSPGLSGWLFGLPSTSSSDPARRLLGIHDISPAATTTDGTTPVDSSEQRSGGGMSLASSGYRQGITSVAPDGIQLSMLLGAGSFGRVYSGVWNNLRVAVKIISHSAEDDTRISSELSLSMSFDHPNLVRALHFARIRINPNSAEASLGAPSAGGTGSLFLPEGAVGVFDLPSTWAVIQKQGLAGPPPMIDTETWIVQDLMDRGNLAAAVRQGAFLEEDGVGIRAAALLRRCADIVAGVTYLHSRNVCHGDLKTENVLLRSEPKDPDGLMAAVADFGLSRALAFGQSHLSTRRYGTVTMMPPELLVAGKLTPAADVYSFGIMMWEMVSRTPPFAGLHHGEVIHKVVTQDLRPGPWPAAAREFLPPDYIPLAEQCWARQALSRPSADQVLQRLVDMLAMVEGV